MEARENEKIMILRMLEEGKISAEEALRLLAALGEARVPSPPPRREEARGRAEEFHERGEGPEEAFESFRHAFAGRFSGVAQAAKEFLGDLFGDVGAVLREIPESGIFRAGETEPLGRSTLDEEPLAATRLAIEGPFDRLKLRPSLSGRIEAEADLFADPSASGETKAAVRLRIDREGERLRLRVDAPHGLRLRAELSVRVPAGMALSCGNGAGRVDAECLDGELLLETGLGTLDVARHRGRVVARTKGGAIRCDEIDGDLEAHSLTGSIRASRVGGNATLDCGNGAIEAEAIGGTLVMTGKNGVLKAAFPAAPGAGPHRAETRNGTVTLLFAPGVAATVDATTRLGRVAALAGVPSPDRDGRFLIEGGGPVFTASAGVGTVTIAPLPPREEPA